MICRHFEQNICSWENLEALQKYEPENTSLTGKLFPTSFINRCYRRSIIPETCTGVKYLPPTISVFRTPVLAQNILSALTETAQSLQKSLGVLFNQKKFKYLKL
jgi:hypothetical protein